MNVEEYEKMFRNEESSWWFCGRQAIVESVLEKFTPFGTNGKSLKTLDIGCGTGLILRDFEERGHEVVGIDFSGLALEFTAGRGAKNLVRGDAQALPFSEDSFDLIVALDVMEHVPDDNAMMDEILRVLKPGGHVVLNVPAHPLLWSEHDVALHHFRRYTSKTLRQVLNRPNSRILKFTYSISTIYPFAFIFRMTGKLRPKKKNAEPQSHMFTLPGWANSLLKGVLFMESKIIRMINMPCGLSLLTVVEKSPSKAP